MNSKISNPVFALLAFALCFALYWPALNGQPVWDDLPYLFKHHPIVNDFSYWTILKDFAWPVSVIGQKLLFGIFKFNYFSYHIINLVLHGLNAWLLLKLAEKIQLPFGRLLFLFFLLHPSNVITVSWMIQFKTLICMLFALLSIWYFLKAHQKKLWYTVSFLFFALSMFSKTASIALPTFYALYLWFHSSKKELLWVIPFFALSLFGAYRILKSPVTEEAVSQLETKPVTPIAAETSSQIEKSTTEIKQIEPEMTLAQKVSERWNLVLQSVHYYFWQTLLPLRNEPIKGLLYSKAGLQEYIHLGFLALMFIIHWGTAIPFYLLAGYLMCAPFLGFLPAPYMNLTWVSDQHLYLAMPFFICFWLSLITRWKYKFSSLVPYAFLPAYCFLIFTATPYYKNEVAFYEASLEADPLNVPVAYNLAITHLFKGDSNQARNITNTMVHMSQVAPEVSKNKYYPYLFILDLKLNPPEGNSP